MIVASKASKSKKPKGGLAGRYSSQVAAESTLRFNPERSTIKAQVQDAAATRDSTIRAARGSAEGIKRAAQVAEPGIRKAYGEAGALLKGTIDMTQPDLAKLSGPIADRIKAAIVRDRERATGRLGESLAGATTELKQRQFDAESGRVNAEGAARSQYASSSAKLGDRLRNIGVEEGAFKQGRSGELSKQASDQNFKASEDAKSRRNSRVIAGVRSDGSKIPGGKADKPGIAKNKRLSADQHAQARETIGKVQSVASKLVSAKSKAGKALSYGQVVDLIATGAPSKAASKGAVDEVKYDALRKKYPDMSESDAKRKASLPDTPGAPGFTGVGDRALARAVVDQARDGYVSRKTTDMLHEAGYSVDELGLTSYTKASPTAPGKVRHQPRRLSRPGSAPSATPGQSRPT